MLIDTVIVSTKLAIINNTPMNNDVQAFVWVPIFNSFMSIPSSRISGSYGNSMLMFLKNHQTYFDSGCNLYSDLQYAGF